MLTNYEEVLSSLKTAVENDERKLKESSAAMIKYFVESIEHCKEVYASIPAGQVPVQEAIDAVNELGLVVGIHGKSNNYIKDWNSVTLGKNDKVQQSPPRGKRSNLSRSSIFCLLPYGIILTFPWGRSRNGAAFLSCSSHSPQV